jgi:membrane protease YdiL (CAAX protease family)
VKKAALQSAAFITFMYALIFGGAALSGGDRFANAIQHVFLTGTLVLLVVGLLVSREPSPLASLKLERAPFGKTVLFGVLGFVAANVVGAVVTTTYLLLAGDLQAKAAQKMEWSSGLAAIPLGWVIPLTLFVGFYEEVAFRGFLFPRMQLALSGRIPDSRRRLIWSAVITGVFFGGLHAYQGIAGVLQTVAVGTVLGLLAGWRASTWPAIVAHFSIDAFGLFALKVLVPMARETLKKLSGADGGM